MANPVVSAPKDQTVTALDIIPITPSDSANLSTPVRAIRCKATGTSGALKIVTYMDTERTTHIVVGETLCVYAKKVLATGTAATGLEGLV